MQLSVKGKQLDVGDALRTHVDESLSRILDKYFGDALEVVVTLSREAHLYRAVISAHVGRGIQIEASGEDNEPYPAFDGAADRLSKRLRRYKRRLWDHNGKTSEAASQPARKYILDAQGPDESNDARHTHPKRAE